MIALIHPVVGMLFFADYEAAHDAALDIGEAYDLNEIGVLKSQVTLCYSI